MSSGEGYILHTHTSKREREGEREKKAILQLKERRYERTRQTKNLSGSKKRPALCFLSVLRGVPASICTRMAPCKGLEGHSRVKLVWLLDPHIPRLGCTHRYDTLGCKTPRLGTDRVPNQSGTPSKL